jgi:NDP-sugar pyrophosphorylase family protein
MDAMILAAGYGKRLRPLTDRTPKVLIEVAGATVLEHIARRLIRAGADRIIVNTHHLADQVERFARERWTLGAELVLSHEPEAALGTGGGLLHAAPYFRRDAPFLLHVGDVISELDLDALYAAQERSVSLATLAVHDRGSSRCVLFDDRGLMGRDNQVEGWERSVRAPDGPVRRWSFAGAHAVSPEIFGRFVEAPPFDILDAYLRMASEGARIAPFDVTGSRWLEVGNPKRLAQAREVLGSPTSSPPAPP